MSAETGTQLMPMEKEDLDTIKAMASLLVASGYFTEQSANRDVAIAQTVTKIIAGRELGFAPYTSVNGINIIRGNPTVSANLTAGSIKAHPRYDYRVRKMDDTEVSIEFLENGKVIGISSFSAMDAKRAGVTNLDKYPRNMLFARAISNGQKWYCPDVFFGNAVYVEGELEGDPPPPVIIVDKESGEVIEQAHRHSGMDTADESIPGSTKENGTSDRLVPTVEKNGKLPPGPYFGQEGEGSQPEILYIDALVAEGLVTLTNITGKQEKKLHAVGSKVYGKDWDAKRPILVKSVTKGREESSKGLTESEADLLISGMQKVKPAAVEKKAETLSKEYFGKADIEQAVVDTDVEAMPF